MPNSPTQECTAFVLGGGGLLGSSEVGMLKALVERDIRPDLVLGTSVGAINGAFYAADPAPVAVTALEQLWKGVAADDVLTGSTLRRMTTLARTRTHAHTQEPLRAMLERQLGDARVEDLEIPFQCVAASIERAAEQWFVHGPLVDAVLASSAVPGMLPPVEIDGEHFLDGGLVHSIPVGRAVALGATRVYVLQVGRIERPLEPPRRPWDVAVVAFEIARRHRFAADMAAVPPGVNVHVLPTGDVDLPRPTDLSALRYRDTARVVERIDLAYEASTAYLVEQEG
ncbi:MAG TPA: patatin-like phospholipase family protein [Jiangellales bacterium]|nr:patatin-like phospholipase family protein [Jiangellales bacterium]